MTTVLHLPAPLPPVLPFRLGGWGTLEIDPPWRADDQGTRLAPEHDGCAAGYRTMSDEEILALGVAAIASDDAHLYLWAVDWKLELALRCVRAWGFDFKQQLAWRKVTKAGAPRLGGGHYFRHTWEPCLFAVRGSKAFPRHDLPSEFAAPRGAHSRKPERLKEIAESVSAGPRIEIFSRSLRAGWTSFGDQAPEISAEPAPITADLGPAP